jgi:ATP-binding cassette subfamily C protein
MTANDRFWPAFRAYVVFVGRTMPARMAAVLAITVAQAFTEGVALLLLVPLLGAVGLDVGRGTVAALADHVRGAFRWLGLTPTLGVVLSAYVVVVSLQALATRWQTMAVLGLEHRFVATLRKRLYAAITRANWLYLSTTRAPELAHVLTQELERVGTGTYQVLTLFSNAMVASVYLALALRLSPTMTLIVCACGAAVLLALRRKVTSARTEGEMVSRARSRLFATAVEHVSALRTAKSYGAEQQHIDSFAAAADDVAHAHVRAIRMHAGSRTQFEIGAVVALALMLYVGLVALGLSPAGVLLLLYVFARTMPRLSALQQAAENVAHYLGSFRSVLQLQTTVESEAEAPALASATIAFRDRIRLEGVSFAHDKGAAGAVQDVSVDIGFGTVTAIVGPSGSGKSTLADLLTGLQRPQRGRVLVDDVALDDSMVLAWKRQVGYVDQDTFLFHDTVAANLRWAHPDATGQEIRDALDLAAADFVFALPDGLETILGDRGVRLSGGERQRLALARALLRKPRLLLLDEATSALDPENENRILDAIDRLRGRVTVVLITHRLSAVRRADAIHVLEGGRVVESGDWRALGSRPEGRFRALRDAQGMDLEQDLPAAAAL